MRKVLAVPIGSADVERAFSLLSHIRNQRRSQLTAYHIDTMLWIHLNGPKVGEFLPLKYAKSWVEKNRLLTDDPNYIKKKRTKVDPNAPDNEQDQEMNQALVLEVEPALVAEVNEDTSGEQYADECGIPIGSQEFKLMDGSTLF